MSYHRSFVPSFAGFFDPDHVLWAAIWAAIAEGLRFSFARRRAIASFIERNGARIAFTSWFVSLVILGISLPLPNTVNLQQAGTPTEVISRLPPTYEISPVQIGALAIAAISLFTYLVSIGIRSRRKPVTL